MDQFIHEERLRNINKIQDIESLKRTYRKKMVINKNIIFFIFAGMVLSIFIEIVSFSFTDGSSIIDTFIDRQRASFGKDEHYVIDPLFPKVTVACALVLTDFEEFHLQATLDVLNNSWLQFCNEFVIFEPCVENKDNKSAMRIICYEEKDLIGFPNQIIHSHMLNHTSSDWIVVSDQLNMVIMENLRMLFFSTKSQKQSTKGVFANANNIKSNSKKPEIFMYAMDRKALATIVKGHSALEETFAIANSFDNVSKVIYFFGIDDFNDPIVNLRYSEPLLNDTYPVLFRANDLKELAILHFQCYHMRSYGV